MPTTASRPAAISAIEIVQDHSNDKLRACLKNVLSDQEVLDAVAKRSYRHQLGFLKLVLLDEVDGCLRLHVWDQPTSIQEDIHSHCAQFQSRVVLGQLTENSFSLIKGNIYSLFRYRFDAHAKHAIAVEAGAVDVEAVASRVLEVGDIYIKNPDQLHNVENAVVGTVTVSAWGERTCDAMVLKSLGSLAEACNASAGMPVDKLVDIILLVIKKLEINDSP